MAEENTNEDNGADDATESTNTSTNDGGDAAADNAASESQDNQDSNGQTGSMLDALGDGEGTDFDFTGEDKPEGFPDEFWDADNNAVNPQALFNEVKKQEKIAKDLRAKMGKGEHKAPEKATDYKLELPEELQELVPADDPLIAKAQERAHELGMSQENFQSFISEMIGDMAEIAADAADPNSEAAEAARAEYVQDQIKQIGPNGAQVLRAVESWGKELVAEGTISEADAQTLKDEGLVSAKMVQLFNRLRSRMGGADIPLAPVDDGLPPDSEIADMLDKAYSSKDEAKIRKAEEMLDKRRAAGRPEKLAF